MSNYFIHTFELSYRTTLKKILELTDHKLVEINGEYKSLKYVGSGITIMCIRCQKEAKDGKGNYKLILIVNPSRLTDAETYSNNIMCLDDFEFALRKLEIIIGSIFPDMELNDFKLSRVDLTNDIRGVPESIIQEYIMIMRRSSLSNGYKLNSDLEKNTDDFRCKDSFNVYNRSQGAEFVVYNKHRASMDQGYPQEYLNYFEDTMRVELRCSRRYINKKTKGLSTVEAILLMYLNREEFVREFYTSIFKYRTDLCYISKRWQKKFIKKSFSPKRSERMIDTIEKLSEIGAHLDNALYDSYNTQKTRTKIPSYFNEAGFSPIPIQLETVSYMSSLDTVLGFSDGKKNLCYKIIKHSKGRKKVIFRYEDFRIPDDR